jgi:Zn-finger nucleic acid-binding protein
MATHTLDGHLGRPVTIDLCQACQALWFDTRESVSLTPGSTLTLFRIIGEGAARPQHRDDAATCPRCRARLRHTHDRQRDVRFQYDSCPSGHGRFTSFFDFLKEKNFIRPLTPQQLAQLRQNVQMVNCSNCGAPVDLSRGVACEHCRSPLSMLDMSQAGALVAQLQKADDRTRGPVDPSLPLELARARRDVELSFATIEGRDPWTGLDASGDLVWAGLQSIARWMKNR